MKTVKPGWWISWV